MRTYSVLFFAIAISTLGAFAQRPSAVPVRAKYLYGKDSPVKVLQHVRIIDGTGRPALQDQTILIDGTKISSIGRDVASPANAEIFDLTGFTVLPG